MKYAARSLTGGARIDGEGVTWPFASLSCTREVIELKVAFTLLASFPGARTIVFPADQVSSIKRLIHIPFLAWGIRIHHAVRDYPKKVIFWHFGFPSQVLNFIGSSGFPLEEKQPIQTPEPTSGLAPGRGSP